MCPHNCYTIVSPGHTHARFTRTLHVRLHARRPPRARRVHGAPGGGFGGDTRPTVIRFVLRPLILNQTQGAKVDCCVRATPPADELNNPRVHCSVCGASVHLSMGHPGSSDGFSCRWSGQVVLASSFRSCSRSLARPRQRYLADRLHNAARA